MLVAVPSTRAIFGFIKALVDRDAAAGFERATGPWPGDEQPPFLESFPAGRSPGHHPTNEYGSTRE